MMDKQRTVSQPIHCEGVGLHTGEKSRLEIVPSAPNAGITFSRRDIASGLIKADFYSVLDTTKFPRRTSIGTQDSYIHTIEHLMAAFHILHIDNAHVNIWGEEVPGLDGSAKGFVDRITEAGTGEQSAPRNYLTLREPLWVEDGESRIMLFPHNGLRISYALKYDNPLIGAGYVDVDLTRPLPDNFYEARTFCLEEEVQPLLDMGLGKGSNYENTLVVSNKGIKNNRIRLDDEFIKHKLLDLVGDLYLAGPIKAHIFAVRSGHKLNIKLLEKLRKYKEKVISGGVGSQTGFIPEGNELKAEEIMKILPHRYPFLLVDRISYLDRGKRAVGIKCVTMNEYFFQGHFPGRPVMPGVLMIEAMAQVGGVLMLACEEHKGKLAFFMAADKVKFRKTVEPGDCLTIEVVAGKVKKKTGTVHAKTYVQNKVVAEAELMFALVGAA
ncbi:MAG: UDP-3-O-[3-hydroxymyristoyl] N-acetylglucosamine deacetylase [Candidatus Omnitrophica bacterium]|nr:UDP-3-O-[3-hydroxymyristoyl] N-acetylglucosamine deacetylase [Candidatus Omnitrophota bacterium]